MYDEVTASNLVKIDLDGNKVENLNGILTLQVLLYIQQYIPQKIMLIVLCILIQTQVWQWLL